MTVSICGPPLKAILKTVGHQSLFAANADAAVTVLQRQSVDLMLVDYHMPGIKGIQLMEQAERFMAKFILMSGDSSVRDLAANHRLPFLEKPFYTKELIGAINTAIENEDTEQD